MGWAEEKPKVVDPLKFREESMWFSAYSDSQERWHKDMVPYYELIGEYEVDESHTLYRYQMNESERANLVVWSPKFQNVVIPHSKQADK